MPKIFLKMRLTHLFNVRNMHFSNANYAFIDEHQIWENQLNCTLEAIKKEQSRLAEMIASFEMHANVASKFPVTLSFPTLNPGELYVGAIISADGTKNHHVILLPNEISDCNWKDAMSWASSINGTLPDRCESALIFATMRDQFKKEYYWTSEEHASGSTFAWVQFFDNGSQDSYLKSYEDRARAIRRSKI